MKKQMIAATSLAFSSALLFAGLGTMSPAAQAASRISHAPITWWIPSPSPIPGTLHAAARRFTKATGIPVHVESFHGQSISQRLLRRLLVALVLTSLRLATLGLQRLRIRVGLFRGRQKCFKPLVVKTSS